MALGKRLISTGAAAAVCNTDSTDPFGDSSGVALYSLDYDASDAGGLYDGTPTNVEFGVGGQINYGARFNGSSSKIDLTLSPNDIVTVSFWFNSTSTTGFFFTAGDFGSYPWLGIFLDAGRISAEYTGNIGGGLDGSSSITNSTYNDGNWHHVACVFTGTYGVNQPVTIYVDGVSDTTDTGDSFTGLITTRNGNCGIGYYISQSIIFLDGDIDQVRIFSKALNQSEVDTLFAETACVYTSTTDIVNYPTGTTPVAYYKMDNSSEDYSTGGNDGTDTNVEYRFGRFGQAAVFNGSSSKITTSADFDGSTAQGSSISFWFKTSSTASQIPIGSQTGLNGSAYGSNFYVGQSTSTLPDESLAFWHYDGGSAYAIFVREGHTAYQNGNWFHCVMTSTSTTKNIYINGVNKTLSYRSNTTASTPFYLTDIQLGVSLGVSDYWNGSIDQVRIYDAALTSSQVTELYNEKPEVDTSNFKAVLYEGNGGTQYISNVGFQPDFVWIKNRDTSNNHMLYDFVRGATKTINSNSTGAEAIHSDALTSFDANGFFLGSKAHVNGNNNDIVAWNWKGSNADAVNIGVNSITGSTPSIASDVSANTAAGFSIVKWTGTEANATIGHGLDNPPELIIIKNASAVKNWTVYSSGVGATKYGKLNLTDDFQTASTAFNNTDPTSSVFSVGSASVANGNGNTMIAYCWHSVSGNSKIGSYSGNQSLNTANQINFGFTPRFVMIKNTTNSGSQWMIFDSVRTNGMALYANQATTEIDYTTDLLLSSQGLEFKSTNVNVNQSGATYIYMAFK